MTIYVVITAHLRNRGIRVGGPGMKSGAVAWNALLFPQVPVPARFPTDMQNSIQKTKNELEWKGSLCQ